MSDALGCKFMGVASFILLHLRCDDCVGDSDLLSNASALVDGYSLSKVPAASRVIPLLNISTVARRLPLPHLAAQSELLLAFALAAARKHVQVEEVQAISIVFVFLAPFRISLALQILQRGEHSLLRFARMPSQRRSACLLAAQCELVAAEVPSHVTLLIVTQPTHPQGLSLHTHALLKLQCLHTAAVLWAAHSSHALCDMLCERARTVEGITSVRLGLEDALAQAAVSLRIPPMTQLCAGNRSVLLGIAHLLWPLIMYS